MKKDRVRQISKGREGVCESEKGRVRTHKYTSEYTINKVQNLYLK